MTCLAEVHFAVIRDYRHSGDEVQGYLGLRHDEVDFSEVSRTVEQVRDVRAQEFREFIQDSDDLPLFREFEFLYLVVEFHHFGRLNECCLSCCGLVVDESRYPLLVGCADRNQHLAVTYGHACIAVHDAFFLCLLEDGRDSS